MQYVIKWFLPGCKYGCTVSFQRRDARKREGRESLQIWYNPVCSTLKLRFKTYNVWWLIIFQNIKRRYKKRNNSYGIQECLHIWLRAIRSTLKRLFVYVYIPVLHICIYIYICIERERDIDIYIDIHTHILHNDVSRVKKSRFPLHGGIHPFKIVICSGQTPTFIGSNFAM